ncbi:MAG: hypothetical protein K9M54_03730 [Kiritimatiellales bacterium]|nr:hypothetical protein [Kiritimatiellales bacterium]MCF7863402.1 hypothetical protein [Kiritimatiellales bacterium]
MARKKAAAEKKKKGRVKRSVLTGLLLALILYIGIQVLSRMEGTRSLVADKISNGTRLPVALESCAATPLLGLHLKGLDFYGVQMTDVQIRFNFFAWLSTDKPLVKRLDIQGLEVKLKRIPTSGNWEPLVLHGLGSKLGAVLGLNPVQLAADDTLPKFPTYVINDKTLLQLRRAKVVWNDEQDNELAYVSDTDLSVKAGMFIDRKVVQTIFKSGHIKLASGKLLRDFRLEAFRIEGSGVVTVLDMADRDGEYDEFATQTLWQDLNLRLNALSAL